MEQIIFSDKKIDVRQCEDSIRIRKRNIFNDIDEISLTKEEFRKIAKGII